MGILTCIGIGIILLALLDWIRFKIRSKKYLVGIPGPTYLPIFGNALDFIPIKDAYRTGARYFFTYGSLFRVNLSFLEVLFVSDAKLAEVITTSSKFIKKSMQYKHLEGWLGQGLLTSAGEKWRKSRKFLTPAFHFNNLEQFLHCFNATGDILIDKLRVEIGKSTTDIYPYLTLCTLDLICESIMGISMNAQNNKNSKYVESVNFMKETVYRRGLSLWKSIDFLYPFSKDYWMERRAMKILHNTTDNVIKMRRDYLLNNPEIKENAGKSTTFLDMLLLGTIDGKSLTDQEIREQVDTFMFEGHDTTSAAISFTLLSIASHPIVQEKILDEIRSVIGEGKNIRPSYQNLLDLKYLNCVIKESLRTFTPVPIIGRTLEEDIEHDGIVYPKGLTIIITMVSMHRYDEYYKDPEVFIPERFSDENYSQQQPYSYLPFSAGFRNCIGQKFALLEMKSIITKVLVNYKLLPVDGYIPEIVPDIVLKAKNGIHLRFEERE